MLSLGNTRFFYGLLMFVGVALLIEQFDNERGTNYTWAYIAVIWLGYAVANNLQIGKGLAALSTATK